jgi:hypothetical protein
MTASAQSMTGDLYMAARNISLLPTGMQNPVASIEIRGP